MRLVRFAPLLLAAVMMFGGSALAGERGTPEEAKALAERAASYLISEGSEVAFAAFNSGGEWRDRDLYVFVIDGTGTWVSHGFLPEKIGKNEIDAVDAGGKHYMREIVYVKHSRFVDYKFKSPADGTVRDKTSYIIKAKGYLVGVGAYKY